MPILESVKVLEKAKACLGLVLHKLEDVLHLDDAVLNGNTSLSKASYSMSSVRTMLERIQPILVNPAFDSHEDDDFSSSFLEWTSAVVDVCIYIEKAISNYFKDAGRIIQPLPEAVERISSKPVNLFALHRLTIEMPNIESKLNKLTNNNLFIMASDDTARVISQPTRESLVPNIEDTWFVGYEAHQKGITEKLLDPSVPQCLQVAIVGPEASGKTGLARRIYQSTAVKKHFDVRLWLFDMNCFDYQCPELFKKIDILRKILITLVPENSLEGYDEQLLILTIHKSLKVKRYLAIIDNVRMYDIFKTAFPSENNGSRVLVATKEIGNYEKLCLGLDPEIIYELPSLTYEERLKLIFRNSLEKNFSLEKHVLHPIARIIASSSWGNCPMNLLLLGGHILFNQQSSHNLEVLRDSATKTTFSEILAVIYNKLPRGIAACFAYMAALFPANYLIHVDSLIRLWIAEGMIPMEDRRTVEQTADLYLDELFQRGLVHIFRAYYHNQDKQPIRIVVMHPLLQSGLFDSYTGIYKLPPVNVILGEDALDKFVYYGEADDDHENFQHFCRLALHVSYECDRFSSFHEGKKIHGFNYPSLHSLFFFGSVAPLMFSEFCFLRVLTVFQARIQFCEEDIPCWLDGLINLRYLGFVVCWLESGSLGKKLSRLADLRTLDLSESFVSGLAEFIEHNTKVNVIGPITKEFQGRWSPVPDLTK